MDVSSWLTRCSDAKLYIARVVLEVPAPPVDAGLL
jgi:hypothetical protein